MYELMAMKTIEIGMPPFSCPTGLKVAHFACYVQRLMKNLLELRA